jgi:hypothetical protein
MQQKNLDAVSAIFLGGIIAATIDIGAASLISGRSPAFIIQAISGGLLGKTTFNGGVATVILGAALQEVMGVLIAAIYVVLSKTVAGLLRRWVTSGLVYGVIVFFVMNYVVVPLSAWNLPPHFTPLKFAANMAAMLLFGLIIAFFSRRLTMSEPLAQDKAATPA